MGLVLQLLRQVKCSAPQQTCSMTFRPYVLCLNSLFLKEGKWLFSASKDFWKDQDIKDVRHSDMEVM